MPNKHLITLSLLLITLTTVAGLPRASKADSLAYSCGTPIECFQKSVKKLQQARQQVRAQQAENEQLLEMLIKAQQQENERLLKAQQAENERILKDQQAKNERIVIENQRLTLENQRLTIENQRVVMDSQQKIGELETKLSQLAKKLVIKNATADADRSYMLSGIYCYWNGSSFSQCSTAHSWDGNLNFNLSITKTSGIKMTAYFQDAYYGQPLCNVTFEGIVAHTKVDTVNNGLNIYLYSADGNNLNWSSVKTWMYIVCHGVD
jgi:hypothetical protein